MVISIRNSIAKKGMTILKGHLTAVNRQRIVDITAIRKKQQQKEKENKAKTYNNLQNTTQKTKDRATRTPQKQTIIYKTLHRKLKIEQHEHHKNKQ
jgi:septum formation inhibitor MinC